MSFIELLNFTMPAWNSPLAKNPSLSSRRTLSDEALSFVHSQPARHPQGCLGALQERRAVRHPRAVWGGQEHSAQRAVGTHVSTQRSSKQNAQT